MTFTIIEKSLDKNCFFRGYHSATTYCIEMATSYPELSSFVLPELPVLPYFDDLPVDTGRKNAFSDNTYGDMVQLVPGLVGDANSVERSPCRYPIKPQRFGKSISTCN